VLKNGKVLQYALHAAVLAGVVWAAFKTIDPRAFEDSLERFNWWVAPAVCALGLASVLVKASRFAGLLRQVKKIPRSLAMKAYVAGQSMTLLPGGIAARSGLLQQVGVTVEESSPAVAMSSISDQLGFILSAAVAAMWFEAARKPVFIFLGFLSILGLILGIEATRTWLIGAIERLLHRFNLADKWRGFVEGMGKTLDLRTVALGVGNSLVSFALLVAGLWLCMRGVGHSIHPFAILLAYTVPTMVGRISAMPGGFGLTELGMVGVLDRLPGVKLSEAAAAVLVFRVATILFTAFVGAILYWTVWRKAAAQRRPATT
jgi:uncharacterized protein (TIRG00374 family)